MRRGLVLGFVFALLALALPLMAVVKVAIDHFRDQDRSPDISVA